MRNILLRTLHTRIQQELDGGYTLSGCSDQGILSHEHHGDMLTDVLNTSPPSRQDSSSAER